MKKILMGAFLFAAISLSAKAASASYVCGVTFTPGGSLGNGTYGYVTFSTYSAANCGGSFTGGYVFCSSGATGYSCSSQTWAYATDSVQMAAIFAELREAAEWNINVSVSTTQCIGAPGYSCVGNLQFKM